MTQSWTDIPLPRFALGYIWTQIQTTVHKFWVARYLLRYHPRFLGRAIRHDLSKYYWSEACGFAEVIFDLKHTVYGTPEYEQLRRRIHPSLLLHYSRNTHHPEHYPNGFQDMTDDDIVELVADWSAATRRTKNGSLEGSIVHNAARFGYDDAQAERLRSIARRMRTLPIHSV